MSIKQNLFIAGFAFLFLLFVGCQPATSEPLRYPQHQKQALQLKYDDSRDWLGISKWKIEFLARDYCYFDLKQYGQDFEACVDFIVGDK